MSEGEATVLLGAEAGVGVKDAGAAPVSELQAHRPSPVAVASAARVRQVLLRWVILVPQFVDGLRSERTCSPTAVPAG